MTPRPITESDLHAFADKALDAARQSEVASYLEGHPEVAERVHGYIAQREALRAAFAPIAEEPVPTALDLAHLVGVPRQSHGAWRHLAAAAVILLALGGIGGWVARSQVGPPGAGIPALAREAAESYAVFATDSTHPVEIKAADRDALLRWVSDRLKRPISAPDLSASGYRFMGGRLAATAHGPAALFMYDDAHGTRLVMLVRLMEAADKSAPMEQFRDHDLVSFAWARQGVGFSLVGPAAARVLYPLADEARRQIDRAHGYF